MKLYFHLRKSEMDVRRDEVGQYFRSLDEAYATVCREIPDMVAEFLRQRTNAMNFSFFVTDENDRLLMDIPFKEMVQSELPHNFPPSKTTRRDECESAKLCCDRGLEAAKEFSIFEHHPFPLIVLTPSFQIVCANRPFEELRGIVQSRLLGRYFFDLFPDRKENDDFAGRRRFEATVREIVRSRRAIVWVNQRYDLRGADGQWTTTHWNIDHWPILDADGQLLGIAHSGRPFEIASGETEERKVTVEA